MKKVFKLFITIIVSLIITFIFAETFSLYHFGDKPTLLTLSYLISLLCIFEYILLLVIYVIKKKRNKEKIGPNKIISLILLFISLILVIGFIVTLNIDWLNYYLPSNSSPFYIYIVVRSLEFLLPSIIIIIISIFLMKK